MLRPAPFPLTHRASQCIASHGITTPAQHQQKPPGPQQIARRKQGLPVGPTSLTPPPPRGSFRHIGAGPSCAHSPFSWRCSQDRANDVAGGCETAIAMTRCLSRSSPRRKMNPLDVKAPRSVFSPSPARGPGAGLILPVSRRSHDITAEAEGQEVATPGAALLAARDNDGRQWERRRQGRWRCPHACANGVDSDGSRGRRRPLSPTHVTVSRGWIRSPLQMPRARVSLEDRSTLERLVQKELATNGPARDNSLQCEMLKLDGPPCSYSLLHVGCTMLPKGSPAENVFPEDRLPILGLCDSSASS